MSLESADPGLIVYNLTLPQRSTIFWTPVDGAVDADLGHDGGGESWMFHVLSIFTISEILWG